MNERYCVKDNYHWCKHLGSTTIRTGNGKRSGVLWCWKYNHILKRKDDKAAKCKKCKEEKK